MSTLINAYLLVAVATYVVNIWGTWLRYGVGTLCSGTPSEWVPGWQFDALLWVTWVGLICFAAMFLLTLNLFPYEPEFELQHPHAWECRWGCLALLCCCHKCALPRPSLYFFLGVCFVHFWIFESVDRDAHKHEGSVTYRPA